MKIAGIDYSMSSPSICLFDGNEFCIERCQFYFLSNKKNLVQSFNGQFHGCRYPEYYDKGDDTKRFDLISDWSIDKLVKFNPDYIAIEGYSFGSSAGMVFNLAENCGILKHKIMRYLPSQHPPTIYAPSVIKKYATGKGNSKKEIMGEYFYKDTSLILPDILCIKSGKWDVNPVSDIVDSYFITKTHHNFINSLK